MDRKMKNSGFSLVELLVAIGIIAILVTVGVVAGGKMYRYMNEKKTASYMEIIKNSIMAFQEDTGDYPATSCAVDEYELCGSNTTSHVNDTLAFYLVSNDFALERLKDLPEEAYSEDPKFDADKSGNDISGVQGGFVDAWDNLLYYSQEAGIGGSPVLLSAGPDGKIGTWNSTNKAYEGDDAEDNISSEK